MSAIQRDREIAAKATQGEWVSENTGGTPASMEPYFEIAPIGEDGSADWRNEVALTVTNADANAEHIVRLNNRQPKYDALVDGIRTMRNRFFKEAVGMGGFGDPNHHERRRGLYAVVDELDLKLAALDSEEP